MRHSSATLFDIDRMDGKPTNTLFESTSKQETNATRVNRRATLNRGEHASSLGHCRHNSDGPYLRPFWLAQAISVLSFPASSVESNWPWQRYVHGGGAGGEPPYSCSVATSPARTRCSWSGWRRAAEQRRLHADSRLKTLDPTSACL